MEDACRHMKAPLSTGRLNGTTITCSWHGWKYDVTTGACHDKSWGAVRTFPVKVENGEVFVSDQENPRPDADAGDEAEDFPTPVFRER
jgi:nitrite reductase/ring-hydroxylating ferredoxin subunit